MRPVRFFSCRKLIRRIHGCQGSWWVCLRKGRAWGLRVYVHCRTSPGRPVCDVSCQGNPRTLRRFSRVSVDSNERDPSHFFRKAQGLPSGCHAKYTLNLTSSYSSYEKAVDEDGKDMMHIHHVHDFTTVAAKVGTACRV